MFAIGGDTVGIVKAAGTVITKRRCVFEGQPLVVPERQVQADAVELQLAWVFLPVDDDSRAITCGDAIRYPMPGGLDYAIAIPPIVETDIRGRENHVFVVAGAPAGADAIAALLAMQGEQIVLTPATGVKIEGPDGDDYGPAQPRPAQRFATFNIGGVDARERSTADRGMVRKLAIRLVGAADAQIEVGDTFSDDIADYKVESVDRSTPYRVDALAAAFLKVTAHGVG